jgi:prepilin-type N-terminal cleavage/methylation domain-containing protein
MVCVRGPRGFTMIEVMIVVTIMAVLAAVIIQRTSVCTNDAKQSTLKHNIHILQTQLQLYKAAHLAEFPTIQSNTLPQLTQSTNVAGKSGPSGVDYPLGPYVIEIPPNPFDGSSKVVAVQRSGVTPSGVVGSLGGWQYDQTTGAIWPNHAEYYSSGGSSTLR